MHEGSQKSLYAWIDRAQHYTRLIPCRSINTALIQQGEKRDLWGSPVMSGTRGKAADPDASQQNITSLSFILTLHLLTKIHAEGH